MKILSSSKISLIVILACTALSAAACSPVAPTDAGTDSPAVNDTGSMPADGSLIDSGVAPVDVSVSVDTGSNMEAATPAQDAAANNG